MQVFVASFDFFLPLKKEGPSNCNIGREETHCEKNENITLALGGMYLENRGDGCMKIVRLGLRCVMDIDRKLSTRYLSSKKSESQIMDSGELTYRRK